MGNAASSNVRDPMAPLTPIPFCTPDHDPTGNRLHAECNSLRKKPWRKRRRQPLEQTEGLSAVKAEEQAPRARIQQFWPLLPRARD